MLFSSYKSLAALITSLLIHRKIIKDLVGGINFQRNTFRHQNYFLKVLTGALPPPPEEEELLLLAADGAG